MNETDKLKQLADRARLEPIPEVDVADRVMAAVSQPAPEPVPFERALVWGAAAAAACALIAVVAGWLSWNTWTDPMMAVFVDLMGDILT
ncbi:MAG: hypothetical protein JXR37_17425 [Kiritimatiellae bacterium]|nr:hypothetical protein [Kiritimatiellia bacterium]